MNVYREVSYMFFEDYPKYNGIPINKGNKTIEVVVQKSYCFEEEVWEVIHVGSFTKKKR